MIACMPPPKTGADLSYQYIELVSERHLVAAFHHKPTLTNHVHEFDASQDAWGCLKGLEVEHRLGDALGIALLALISSIAALLAPLLSRVTFSEHR